MSIKTIFLTSIYLSIVGLTACGGGGDATPALQNKSSISTATSSAATSSAVTSSAVTSSSTALVGNIEGTVRSEIIDVNVCQLYLYDQAVTSFADAYDQSHASFIMPDTAIVGTAPIKTSKISSTGSYSFENIKAGTYQLVFSCIIGKDIQDESQLVDDPIQYQGHIIPNSVGITPNILIVTVTANATTRENFIDTRIKPVVDDKADVIVRADMTDLSRRNKALHDMWATLNRIAPQTGVVVIDGMKVNTVRMLGGIMKKDANGKNVPDLAYDTATYNEQTKQYEYNFEPLVNRINAIVNKGKNLHQIVLDQPAWAFQQGHSFIADNQPYDGVSFKEKQRVSTYGNSLPPKDKVAYNQFLQATMNHLVAVYGEEKVLSWRFRIGSEIETPDHWYGSEQDFVEHFANSVNAIRAVLPKAKIGLHTRSPGFVYKNGTETNYKNEPIKSFANAIIEYCADHNIKYDFWGISDYPFITNKSAHIAARDPKSKYEEFFKPLVEHPKWQAGTVLDLEEYSLITHMGFVAPIYAYITADSPQADTFNIALTDEFYRHEINEVFQWGLRNGDKPWPVEIFKTMLGQPRIDVDVNVNTVGSIVVTDLSDNSIQAVTYHYDPRDLEAENNRQVKLSFKVDKPIGTTYTYRKKISAPENHAYYNFMKQDGSSDWLKSGGIFNKYGSPDIVLNENGLTSWRNYQHTNQISWTQWKTATTVAPSDGKAGSQVIIDSVLPLFSFEKTEITWPDNL